MPNVVKVVCAIIEDEGLILAARRSEKMNFALKWEFPGGKVEEGETPEDAIIREIKEELDLDIYVIGSLPTYFHSYVFRCIEFFPFICRIKDGKIKLNEHKEIIWDKPDNLAGLEWADADRIIYKEYIMYLNAKADKQD